MRVGNNPLRGKAAERLKPVVTAIVTHLPNVTEPYHANRLEVVKLSLLSMQRHANTDHSVIIWDNGSCDKLRDWIHDVINPDVFIQSVNIGKSAARKSMLAMLPAGTICAYADDDIYYEKGWLEPQINVLKAIPNVACVTGYPVRTAQRWGTFNTVNWARKHGVVTEGRFIPELWERDFCDSIGREWETHWANTRNMVDLAMDYQGYSVYLMGHHCQMVGYAGVLNHAAHYDDEAMGDEKLFDIKLDDVGLRLSTRARLTRHIGNVVHKKLIDDIGDDVLWQLVSQH